MQSATISNYAKIFFALFSIAFGVNHIFASDNTAKEKELLAARSTLEIFLESSPQAIIGYFDTDSLDASQIKSSEPVEIPFIIEQKIKWDDTVIEKFIVPVPYKLFVLRTEKAKESFKKKWGRIEGMFHKKQAELSQGIINDAEWQQFTEMRDDFWSSHGNEMRFVQGNWRGESFKPETKYAMFLYRPIDSDIDWARMISDRTVPLGENPFTDLLMEYVEH